jgi:multidrug efflux pump subunit AcrA (membrane-fusion protein)
MVTVIIPEGAKPALRRGQEVSVTLPIIHHGKTAASVAALAPGEIRLLLAKQVQELNGQEVRVEIPLKPQGICRVPFQSIDSPRGLSKQVLVLNDNHVEARDVKIVALAGGTDILVTGPLAAGDQVVVEGLDNLLSGDEVQVVPAPEGAE